MNDRLYDVILYGASGFVGRQTVAYFAGNANSVRWAIAGRDRQKLENVRSSAGVNVDVLVADSRDIEAIEAMVAKTRVILNTAGPFALYGNSIVDACVRSRTHYVDITGETAWVRDLIDRYSDRTEADGTRIIPFCGFDSIPSDLGTYLIVRYLRERFGVDCRGVKAYFQAYGGFNGGTLASAFNIFDSGQSDRVRDPFLLDNLKEHPPEERERQRDPESPFFDRDIDTWVAPFFMGVVNTRVVRRSAALFDRWGEPYGEDFTYQEYLKFDPPLDWLSATAATVGTGLFLATFQQPAVRQLLQPFLPKPGSGPSEQTMNEGWFRCQLLGFAEDGRVVRGEISDRGDPGNRATVKFLCESALALVLNKEELPGGSRRGGILTPATGLGDVLARRLRDAGMKIEIA
ncbi:saccharopine dehydrogenase NADP-binding domain-containing protein [Pannus brasiliensis CCIBt3594]|uniref:Saccharopine dehydrogenase NADP-binding domain-containing protein n=1 Tax=Pannus brasiliensis CCIBt3594 TaxID=1427578 RepID=A0AAW9QZY8_9CHRO